MPVHLPRTVVATALVAAALLAHTPSAGAGEGLVCDIVKRETLTPGLALTPSSGTYTTDGPQPAQCTGTIDGARPTGPGTYVNRGSYGTVDPDSCLGGEGTGRFTLQFPTDRGTTTIRRTFGFTFGDPSVRGGIVAGQLGGEDFVGTFEVVPVEGDCVVRPLTRTYETVQITFQGS